MQAARSNDPERCGSTDTSGAEGRARLRSVPRRLGLSTPSVPRRWLPRESFGESALLGLRREHTTRFFVFLGAGKPCNYGLLARAKSVTAASSIPGRCQPARRSQDHLEANPRCREIGQNQQRRWRVHRRLSRRPHAARQRLGAPASPTDPRRSQISALPWRRRVRGPTKHTQKSEVGAS